MLAGQKRALPITKHPRSFQSYVNEMCGQVGLASNTLRFQTEKRDVPPSKIVTQSCLVKMSHTYEFSQSPGKSLRPALVSIFENSTCSDLTLLVNKTREFRLNKCILAVRSPPLSKLIRVQMDKERLKAAGERKMKAEEAIGVKNDAEIPQAKEEAKEEAKEAVQTGEQPTDGGEERRNSLKGTTDGEDGSDSKDSESGSDADGDGPTHVELRDVPSIDLFELLLRWLYSASVEVPQNVFEITQLFFIAHEYQVMDLMSRCEHEIINRINSINVTDILLLFHPVHKAPAAEQKAVARQVIRKSQRLVAGATSPQLVEQSDASEESETEQRPTAEQDGGQEEGDADTDAAEECKQASGTAAALSGGAIPLRLPEEEASPESAQFLYNVSQRYQESVDNILDTAKSFFLNEFQEILSSLSLLPLLRAV